MYWIQAALLHSSLHLVPSLEVGYRLGPVYIKQISSAECSPQAWHIWAPKTATWIIEAGASYKDFTLFLGHKSYHKIGSFDNLQSYDYVALSYRKEFK